MNADNNLLICHQGALGDLITIFPILECLQKHGAVVTLVCQAQWRRLPMALKLAKTTLATETALFAELHAPTPQTDLPDQLQTFLNRFERILCLTFFNRAVARLMSVYPEKVLHIPPRPPAAQRIPVLDFLVTRLRAAGWLNEIDRTRIHSPRTRVASYCSDNADYKSRVVLHPGAGSRLKMWPVKRFAALARSLQADGLQPLWIFGPAEKKLYERFTHRHTDQPARFITDVESLLDQLCQAGGFIGNDSGSGHLAAYLGQPTVVVFGPSDPERWTPFGPFVKTVAPNPPCGPCQETHTGDCHADTAAPACLEMTRYEDVYRIFHTLYKSANRLTNL